jgi:hypothetical protein
VDLNQRGLAEIEFSGTYWICLLGIKYYTRLLLKGHKPFIKLSSEFFGARLAAGRPEYTKPSGSSQKTLRVSSVNLLEYQVDGPYHGTNTVAEKTLRVSTCLPIIGQSYIPRQAGLRLVC